MYKDKNIHQYYDPSKATGPKTFGGKLRNSVVHCKRFGTMDKIPKNKKSMVRKMITEAEEKYKIPKVTLEQYNLFVSWIRSRSTDELNTICKLENLISILELDAHKSCLEKLENGERIDADDMKQLKLLKEMLESVHRMKHGEKHINITADFKDIRELMFNDYTPSKREEFPTGTDQGMG